MLVVYVIQAIVVHHVINKNVHQVLIHLMDMEMKQEEIVLEEEFVIIPRVLALVSQVSLEPDANIKQL